MRKFLESTFAFLALCAPVFAVTPDEMLADPVLESRARALGRELRCVVCQNQSIDDSSAQLAHDLRLLLRERLAAGDSDEAAISHIAARYGDFVLLKPPANLTTALLWSGPALFLATAAAVALWRFRRDPAAAAALSAEERRTLAALLEEKDPT